MRNDHLTKDEPQETLSKPDDLWISHRKDIKPYILEHLDNVKLSRSQCIATSIINYGSYKENIFTLQMYKTY